MHLPVTLSNTTALCTCMVAAIVVSLDDDQPDLAEQNDNKRGQHENEAGP
jgi:hypothetical protein